MMKIEQVTLLLKDRLFKLAISETVFHTGRLVLKTLFSLRWQW